MNRCLYIMSLICGPNICLSQRTVRERMGSDIDLWRAWWSCYL